MKKIFMQSMVLLIAIAVFSQCDQANGSEGEAKDEKRGFSINELAPKPPLGWNSFDAWDCRIDESTFKETVDVMYEKLKPFGWEYAVIDYIWWHPNPGHWNTAENHYRRIGHPNIRFKEDGSLLNPDNTRMDEFGRLIPAVERFPSADGGKGFKDVADYVHDKGLKFGIHIMRGVHIGAVNQKLKIKGTEYTMDQIAEPWDTCRWNNHMYGVDATKPGAQEYYNSLFELYAQWGVDYVKVDDIAYPDFHGGEVALIKNAIENCGRPMVLSLSPGEALLGEANFLKDHANMWRISADFWDEWDHLRHSFDLLNSWSAHTGPGSWPDADMIPFGKISIDDRPHGPERMSMFTQNEHYTLMSLWAIARSPMMIGSDLLSTPDSILAFYQNEDVMYVNQYSENGHQARNEGDQIVWVADDQKSNDKFIALFNVSDKVQDVFFDLEWEMIRGKFEVKDLWTNKDIQLVKDRIKVELGPHEGTLLRVSEMK
ncbi:glycoside hydrolase family 27 protein [Reichenbachiella ulvae]|uniref:Alpha-galactosidase n=1 Tax=Reichenbachiella ulvae TaxID=2980104 RepID=A0ABT3D0D5_9BACT|nr:glycoside hydrolase family 27 protein [Reichenbachiella ulvae]MCV9389281.1 glycoside hydrolase family 27 protein [Reichenbachiella ulvae]